ncbi:acetyl-coenzyme A synthetase 2-like, mitochondrial [Hyalella azteca]|uniref:Acetyl-coenzyme A synthetase n=1 Tax=Hyalella azteca TaxID=294128 RepID=A0A8B7NK95_HYAAZ|nr:acetyl-coenzyme A synthetase 2-like, mitochondrial [Hyalella azteca]
MTCKLWRYSPSSGLRIFSSTAIGPTFPQFLLASASTCTSAQRFSTTSKYSSENIISSPLPEITNKFPQLKNYSQLYDFSLRESDQFWGTLGSELLQWNEPFTTVSRHDHKSSTFRWFHDGKLNAAVNCVDRHAAEHPDRVALIWERDEPGHEQRVTYRELQEMVWRVAGVLTESGVSAGDRVAIYLPVSPVAVATMLGCARIGAVHSVVFAGFSAQALASRIQDAGASVLVTANSSTRGGRLIPLQATARAAVALCPGVRQVFVMPHSPQPLELADNEVDLERAMSAVQTAPPPSVQGAEDPLFLLYTSGSTGKPKGLVHTTAGYLLYAALTHRLVFDYKPGDVFGCVADIGWITGHSYVVYGPLLNGGTTVLFESTPVHPDAGRYWETVERLRITQFYGAPTAIRLLLRFGDDFVKKYDRSSLRVLGSVGEPINSEAWRWYYDVVGDGRCTVVDTWWQSETGGIMIHMTVPQRRGSGTVLCCAVLSDSQGKPVYDSGATGALCVSSIWPGIARTIHGDHQRYHDTYFAPYAGLYFSGDGARRDDEGYLHITGRMDDVINVSGHRLGTAEVEDVMMEHPEVSETAVVGCPHALKGETIFAFLVLKENSASPQHKIETELRESVKHNIASYAVPEFMLIAPALPKTRSGKIMRRLLRQIAKGNLEDLGDTSTLADPAAVETVLKLYRQMPVKPTS